MAENEENIGGTKKPPPSIEWFLGAGVGVPVCGALGVMAANDYSTTHAGWLIGLLFVMLIGYFCVRIVWPLKFATDPKELAEALAKEALAKGESHLQIEQARAESKTEIADERVRDIGEIVESLPVVPVKAEFLESWNQIHTDEWRKRLQKLIEHGERSKIAISVIFKLGLHEVAEQCVDALKEVGYRAYILGEIATGFRLPPNSSLRVRLYHYPIQNACFGSLAANLRSVPNSTAQLS